MSESEPRPEDRSGGAPLPAEPRFTRYEILARLGSGGMGVVYHARDRMLGREVALKVLRWERSETSQDVARFLREARTGATLDHPGIVRTLDVGEEGGLHYIVQEFVPGQTLEELLRKR
ncbi:MAG: protein kinase, partial [Planctomycetes bacterium]|nr:protein kinase [Planctomycetota bacterium]